MILGGSTPSLRTLILVAYPQSLGTLLSGGVKALFSNINRSNNVSTLQRVNLLNLNNEVATKSYLENLNYSPSSNVHAAHQAVSSVY